MLVGNIKDHFYDNQESRARIEESSFDKRNGTIVANDIYFPTLHKNHIEAHFRFEASVGRNLEPLPLHHTAR